LLWFCKAPLHRAATIICKSCSVQQLIVVGRIWAFRDIWRTRTNYFLCLSPTLKVELRVDSGPDREAYSLRPKAPFHSSCSCIKMQPLDRPETQKPKEIIINESKQLVVLIKNTVELSLLSLQRFLRGSCCFVVLIVACQTTTTLHAEKTGPERIVDVGFLSASLFVNG